MRELFPKARKIGMAWNPSEACSEACMLKARKAAAAQGFELLEATVGSTGEVMDAVRSLAARGIDLFQVIQGEDPKMIPISDFTSEKIYINLQLAKEYGIELPEALVKRAAYIKR